MVGVAGGEGVRRRLPPWMQRKPSTPSSDRDNRDEVQEVEDELVSCKQSKKAALPVGKGETKRRKREVSQQDAPSDNGAASATKLSTCLQEKQVREPSHRRKRKATSGRSGSGRDSKTLSPFDDGEELTPEDLVSIAEEYVKADKSAGLQELSTRECDFARQLSTAASPKADSESSLIAIDGNQKSPADETTSDSTRGPKDDKYFINTNRTGDPTQDMLDLFLGPLLKKTVEEKMSEFVPRTFSNELEKGSQNDVKEETLPLTKKRCTLRDKVAMLLD